MRNLTVLFDISSMFNRAYFASANSEERVYDKNNVDITALDALQKMIIKVIKTYQPKYVVGCLDAEGDYFRHQMYPEYKGTRDEKPEDFKILKKRIPAMLKYMGIHAEVLNNYEADDIIASYVKKLKGHTKVLIVSQDNDLKQCVSQGIALLQRKKNEDVIVSINSLQEELDGLDIDSFLGLKALIGDKSDNIDGVKGIGQKTALKLLDGRTFVDFMNYLKTSDVDKLSKKEISILDNLDIVRRNYKLMQLVSNLDVSNKISYNPQ